VRFLAALAMSAAIVACNSSGVAQHSSSPAITTPVEASTASPAQPSPYITGQPMAVYDGPSLSQYLHLITLVAITGPAGPWDRQAGPGQIAKVVASVPAAYRSWRPRPGEMGPIELPYVSTSSSKVYFLDGDATLRSLSATGTVATVGTLPGDSARRVGFAVSPDDKRIAVAVIDYSPTTASAARNAYGQPLPFLQLYVEDLGGGHRVQILESSMFYFWPVGWHKGKIVLASGPALVQDYSPLNPFSASRYFLVAPVPSSTSKLVVIGGAGDCAPTGAPTPAGTACVADPGLPCQGQFVSTYQNVDWYTSCLRRLDWDGVETNFLMARPNLTRLVVTQAALSSDGGVILTDGYFLITPPVDGHGGWQNQYGMPPPAAPPRPGMGWFDPFHFSMTYPQPDGTGFQRILWFTADREEMRDVRFDGYPFAGGVAPSPVTGELVGSLPGGL
jgi:hypothetical protein